MYKRFADLPEVLTAKETAKELRISLNAMYEALRTHKVASVRMGSRYLIPKYAVAEAFGMPAAVASEPETAPADSKAVDPIDDFCGALARLLRHMRLNPE